MKMSSLISLQNNKIILSLCFATLLWSVSAWSSLPSESYEKSERTLLKKVYVTPEQLEITTDGIIVYTISGEMSVFAKELSYDEKGLFLRAIASERGPCGIHSEWCSHCGGCGVIYCPMKCMCYN